MIKITHHIEFDFKDREASDLEKLNKILASMLFGILLFSSRVAGKN